VIPLTTRASTSAWHASAQVSHIKVKRLARANAMAGGKIVLDRHDGTGQATDAGATINGASPAR